jgi:apolipoprotein N-acyltransferase
MPLLFYTYGSSYKDQFNTSDKVTYDYKIRAISSNISLDRFYNNIEPVSVINDLIKISEPNKNEKIIFVWPEGILPNISQKELIEYKWVFKENFNENHLLIIGINNQVSSNEDIKYFNSLSIYDDNLNLLHSYNKINLVPFGEFLPLKQY